MSCLAWFVQSDRFVQHVFEMSEAGRATGVPVSTQIIDIRILTRGYRARRPASRPLLIPRQRRARLASGASGLTVPSITGTMVASADESWPSPSTPSWEKVRRQMFLDRGYVHVWSAIHRGGKFESVVLDKNTK